MLEVLSMGTARLLGGIAHNRAGKGPGLGLGLDSRGLRLGTGSSQFG